MKNEFEKLDQFMLRNRPATLALPMKKSPGPRKNVWLGYAVACGISAIVAFNVVSNHHEKSDSALLVSEVLSWDVTSDEFPAEIEAEFAMLDY